MSIQGTAHGIYPTLDTLNPVAPDLWVVDSGPLRATGILLAVRMMVVRLQDGGLLLRSPTRFTGGLWQELAALGPVRHLAASKSLHWA